MKPGRTKRRAFAFGPLPLPLLLLLLFEAPAVAADVAQAARGQAPASGDSTSAASHFERGARAYESGRFDEAIASFEHAYALDPEPILLFNIAQAYRRLGNTEQALHHYRRYHDSAPPNAPDQADAERRIVELEAARTSAGPGVTSPNQRVVLGAPPAAADRASTIVRSTAAPSSTRDSADSGRRWRVGVEGGAAIPRFQGPVEIDSYISYAARALAGYRFGSGQTLVEVGGSVSITSITYRHTDAAMKESASALVGSAARVEVIHALSSRISVAGELLAGVTWWTGLGLDNPFTVEGAAASGPLPMPWARVAIGLHGYLVPAKLFVYVQPAFAFYKPLDDGLRQNVSSVTTVDLPIGMGYLF
jgi:hypothetical protein